MWRNSSTAEGRDHLCFNFSIFGRRRANEIVHFRCLSRQAELGSLALLADKVQHFWARACTVDGRLTSLAAYQEAYPHVEQGTNYCLSRHFSTGADVDDILHATGQSVCAGLIWGSAFVQESRRDHRSAGRHDSTRAIVGPLISRDKPRFSCLSLDASDPMGWGIISKPPAPKLLLVIFAIAKSGVALRPPNLNQGHIELSWLLLQHPQIASSRDVSSTLETKYINLCWSPPVSTSDLIESYTLRSWQLTPRLPYQATTTLLQYLLPTSTLQVSLEGNISSELKVEP